MDEDQTTTVEAGTEAVGSDVADALMLGDDGELNIPESFWDDDLSESGESGEPSEPAEEATSEEEPAGEPDPAKKPAEEVDESGKHYSKEELAEAFTSGRVDRDRVPPELRDYYDAIEASALRRAEAERIRQEMEPSRQVQQGQPDQLTPAERYRQLSTAAKELAARNYLGIGADEVDEYNPQHQAAIQHAMQDIREYAANLQRQHAAVEVKRAEFANLYAEYRGKEPDMERIDNEFFPRWRENLTVKENRAVDAILASGDIGKIRQLFDRIVGDYKAGKEGKEGKKDKEGGGKPEPVKIPPPVESAASGGGEETPGVVDVSKLGDMDIDEQVDFLLKNKFAEV